MTRIELHEDHQIVYRGNLSEVDAFGEYFDSDDEEDEASEEGSESSQDTNKRTKKTGKKPGNKRTPAQ